MSNDWYNIPRETKINAYTQISEATGMAPYAVEKDWWVVQVLSTIFDMEIGKNLIFKGGTSLSKAWGLIERFSEDIDLVFDRSHFGFDGELTRTQVKNLRKKAGIYFESTLSHDLESAFAQEPIEIPTAIPERTFLEKLFLLHEEFHRPKDRIRVDRLSRHLYDLFQLLKSEYGLRAIGGHDLYMTIVKHRYIFNRIGGVNYNHHQPQTLNPLPIPDFIVAWEDDYKTMQEEMIYGESPDFQELISSIENFTKNVLNQVDWSMDIEFPMPK